MKKYIYILCCIILFCYSCDDIIEVEDISQDRVQVLAPTDNVTLNTTNVIFSWQALNDAEQYQLQIATPNFEEAAQIVEDTIVTNTAYTRTLEANNYQWRITALNSAFASQTETITFTIED